MYFIRKITKYKKNIQKSYDVKEKKFKIKLIKWRAGIIMFYD
jgi:hypothetical protein